MFQHIGDASSPALLQQKTAKPRESETLVEVNNFHFYKK
jgi:hypothetical protein